MIKARVNTNLNIRTKEPFILPDNNPNNAFYKPGDEIEIAEIVTGGEYKGNNTWYKLTNGTFVWSGGVDAINESTNDTNQSSEVDSNSQSGNYPWWLVNSLYSIPKLWTLKDEQLVKVAILDTGISKHIDFDFSKITGYNYLSNSIDYQTDNKGHGTHCAGIIAARGTKSYGVAPDTHLFIAKVCDDKGRPIMKAVQKAIEDIYFERNGSIGIRIINISFNLPAQSEEDSLILKDIESLLIKLALEKHCIIVCSSGSIKDIDDSFPAKLVECIAVGSINLKLERSTFSRITPILDIMAPGEAITSSYSTDLLKTFDGTSQAAAFVSGVCSLAIQKMNNRPFDSDLFRKSIYQSAFSNSFLLQEYGHGIINPNKLIETILK